MSEPIIVKAPFSDISQLAHGFVERVSGDSVVLPSATSVPPGQWTQFTVLLNDGTVAFTGVGRSARSADRGPQAPPRSRYDVLLDSLRFEESSMLVFEQLVAASQSVFQSEPRPSDGPLGPEWHTADVADDEVEQIASDSMRVLAGASGSAVRAPSGAVQQPSPNGQNPFPGSILQRPVRMKAWQPEAKPTQTASASSGLFSYQGGRLPRPERAPRPDLAPDMKVTPAPKPVVAARPPTPAATQPAAEGKKAVAAAKPRDVINVRPAPIKTKENARESAAPPKQSEEPVFSESATKELLVSPDSLSEEGAVDIETVPPPADSAFPAERITAKIRDEKLDDLLASASERPSERPSKGRRRRNSKHPKR
jgi:hypothetical protein